jgi:tetratricopeptide (TPR) repeat protein
LLERDPKAADGELLLGDVLIAQAKVQEALSRYKLAASLIPKDPRPYYGMGVTHRLLKNNDQAIGAFETALSLDPDMVNALAQEAAIYWNSGHQAQAFARVQEQIKRSPKNAQLQDLLGLMYLAGSDVTNAQQSFAEAININHSLPASYLLLGDTYVRGKLYELATKKFQEALQIDPNNVLAYMKLGIVDELQGHFDQAGQYYQKAVELNGSYVPALNNLAWYYAESKGNLETAQRYVARALALDPHNPYVLDTQGWIYYKRGQYAPAVQYLSESAQALKTHPLIHYHLGMAYLSDGRKDLAGKELRDALALTQDFPGASEARKALLSLQ